TGEPRLPGRGPAHPAVPAGHDDEEDRSDHDGDAADPAENTTAQQLLEVGPRLPDGTRLTRRRPDRRRRDDGRCGRGSVRICRPQTAFEGLHPVFEEVEALLDRSFHLLSSLEPVIAFLLWALYSTSAMSV